MAYRLTWIVLLGPAMAFRVSPVALAVARVARTRRGGRRERGGSSSATRSSGACSRRRPRKARPLPAAVRGRRRGSRTLRDDPAWLAGDEAAASAAARSAAVAAVLDELRADGSVPMLAGWRATRRSRSGRRSTRPRAIVERARVRSSACRRTAASRTATCATAATGRGRRTCGSAAARTTSRRGRACSTASRRAGSRRASRRRRAWRRSARRRRACPPPSPRASRASAASRTPASTPTAGASSRTCSSTSTCGSTRRSARCRRRGRRVQTAARRRRRRAARPPEPRFKPNVGVVLVDFMVRHGFVNPDEEGHIEGDGRAALRRRAVGHRASRRVACLSWRAATRPPGRCSRASKPPRNPHIPMARELNKNGRPVPERRAGPRARAPRRRGPLAARAVCVLLLRASFRRARGALRARAPPTRCATRARALRASRKGRPGLRGGRARRRCARAAREREHDREHEHAPRTNAQRANMKTCPAVWTYAEVQIETPRVLRRRRRTRAAQSREPADHAAMAAPASAGQSDPCARRARAVRRRVPAARCAPCIGAGAITKRVAPPGRRRRGAPCCSTGPRRRRRARAPPYCGGGARARMPRPKRDGGSSAQSSKCCGGGGAPGMKSTLERGLTSSASR